MAYKSYVSQVLAIGAAKLSKKLVGKICHYELICVSKGENVKLEDDGKKGTCQILGLHYNPVLDCNVYSLLDLETNREFHSSVFEVNLESM